MRGSESGSIGGGWGGIMTSVHFYECGYGVKGNEEVGWGDRGVGWIVLCGRCLITKTLILSAIVFCSVMLRRVANDDRGAEAR